MGRKLHTQLPALSCVLDKKGGSDKLNLAKEREEVYRTNQERNFDQRHCGKDLLQLEPGDCVWNSRPDPLVHEPSALIPGQVRHGYCKEEPISLSSYLVRSDMGTVRRNQSALAHTWSGQTRVL